MTTPRRPSASAFTAAFALSATLFTAACGSSGKGSGGPADIPLLPAEYLARGSVGQVYVTDAVAGSDLELVDSSGSVVQSSVADANGSYIFRQVAAASGYRVT